MEEAGEEACGDHSDNGEEEEAVMVIVTVGKKKRRKKRLKDESGKELVRGTGGER